MTDNRSKYERGSQFLVRWAVVIMLVIWTPLWFLESAHTLNKTSEWDFFDRLYAAALPFGIFMGGWLWCQQWQRRKIKKEIDRVVKANPEWNGFKQR